MGGLAGGTGDAFCADSGEALCRAMISPLSHYDASHVRVAAFAGRAGALACFDGGGDCLASEAGTVLVYGKPRITNASLAQRGVEQGLAAALAYEYRENGPGFLSTLLGPFAVAIMDGRGDKNLLAVDRMGICSLCYIYENGVLTFASALTALQQHPQARLDVDPQAIFNYLYFHVVPSPRSIYENVIRMEPGSYVEIIKGQCHKKEYWQPRHVDEYERREVGDFKPEFRGLLRRAVEEERGRGREIGCFLSGGTDSSTVAGVLAEVSEEPARTYSIGFDESGFDETSYARTAATHFGTDHHEYYVTPQDIMELAPRIPEIYGEPFGNSSVIPTYFCAKLAKEDGVEHLLAGDGGDELFGGNERYARQKVFSLYDRIPGVLRRYAIEPMLFSAPFGDRLGVIRKGRSYVEQARIEMPARMETYNLLVRLGMENVLEPGFMAAVNIEEPVAQQAKVYDAALAQDIVNKMLTLDFKFTLADNDLRKVNTMCELAGVSVGYPLLADELVEFSLKLPVEHKVRGSRLRYFFKEALRDFLPDAVITKQKHGFGLPFGKWVESHDGLREMSFDLLRTFQNRGYVRSTFVDEIMQRTLQEHATYYGTFIWILMILEQWFQHQAIVPRKTV